MFCEVVAGFRVWRVAQFQKCRGARQASLIFAPQKAEILRRLSDEWRKTQPHSGDGARCEDGNLPAPAFATGFANRAALRTLELPADFHQRPAAHRTGGPERRQRVRQFRARFVPRAEKA